MSLDHGRLTTLSSGRRSSEIFPLDFATTVHTSKTCCGAGPNVTSLFMRFQHLDNNEPADEPVDRIAKGKITDNELIDDEPTGKLVGYKSADNQPVDDEPTDEPTKGEPADETIESKTAKTAFYKMSPPPCAEAPLRVGTSTMSSISACLTLVPFQEQWHHKHPQISTILRFLLRFLDCCGSLSTLPIKPIREILEDLRGGVDARHATRPG
ncbi:hypothetical protein FGG08_000628 [Glutinoglossum americanum]|uniref:Uncharacterized protein n=1 Tax=Glutinoglossum americanum TaxID=1670608 RepID=A0A9P8I8N3_9PEZI|nr:hypothetical protein FGG08_000628 [Glutinoglossum americanum]